MTPNGAWHHTILTTCGAWLYSDARGFRTRPHREHVEGDYKNPPPPGKYAEREPKSPQSFKQPPVMLVSNDDNAQRDAVGAGALPGFGKPALGYPAILGRLRAVPDVWPIRRQLPAQGPVRLTNRRGAAVSFDYEEPGPRSVSCGTTRPTRP
jgi:hypothetical protein